jgi:CMP-N,N'-diacetyllegionaminic acid synthase
MKTLFLIPARGGSKGIPGKNIKEFNGKPLIYYSIDLARKFSKDIDICLSSDNENVIKMAELYNLDIPFRRPSELATDQASGYDVIIHAIEFYEAKGVYYDCVALLQPTSPLRKESQLKDCLELFNMELDMVVSVEEIYNPIYLCYDESKEGYLKKMVDNNFTRRQDIPKVFKYNGAFYIMNVNSLKRLNINQFKKIKKYVMDDFSSIDLDTPLEWQMAEYIQKRNL